MIWCQKFLLTDHSAACFLKGLELFPGIKDKVETVMAQNARSSNKSTTPGECLTLCIKFSNLTRSLTNQDTPFKEKPYVPSSKEHEVTPKANSNSNHNLNKRPFIPKGKGEGKGKEKVAANTKDNSKVKCFACNKNGHYANKCTERPIEKGK